MVSKPPWFAALCGDDKNIDIPVVFTCKCDITAIGRKHRTILHTGAARQSDGTSAIARNAPKIARIGKSNMRPAQSRLSQKHVRPVLSGCANAKNEDKYDHGEGSLHYDSPVMLKLSAIGKYTLRTVGLGSFGKPSNHVIFVGSRGCACVDRGGSDRRPSPRPPCSHFRQIRRVCEG